MVRTHNIDDAVIGDDVTLLVTVKTNNQVFNVAGSTSYLTIKQNYSDLDGDALSQTSGVIQEDGSAGEIEFNVPNADTSGASTTAPYYYDVQVTTSSGRKYTVIRGRMMFVDPITTI